uniref:mitochondrial import receptor subunit TOM40 homolog n=1 Tax=Myxine glutinosa TaxID=7769 RepID=UPI00358DDCC2
MGNVLAAAPAVPPPFPMTGMPVVPGTVPATPGPGTGKDPADHNPGSFDELHRKCKEVFPVQMEGVRLLINKGLSNHFQVSHTVNLSTMGVSNYHFGATYVGVKQISPTECFPVCISDIDNSGSMNGQVIHQVTDGVRAKAAFQTQKSRFVTWQVDTEYRAPSYTAAIALGNPDVLLGSAVLVTHYLQALSPTLALGGELVYHRRPGEEGAMSTIVARYAVNNWVATMNIGASGVHASYHHKASDQIQVGVELEANARLQETLCTLGYQVDLPRTNMVFRGSVDSNWTVSSVLEKKLPPLPLTLALAAAINHRKHKFQCGFGLTIG